MKNFKKRRLVSPQISLSVLVLLPLLLTLGGCGNSQSASTAPPMSPAEVTAKKIKEIEADTRMPADAKAREIARVRAEERDSR